MTIAPRYAASARRLARSAPAGLRSAARNSSVMALTESPRYRSAWATCSSREATFSSGPVLASARCQARRAGSPACRSARISWARRRSSSVASSTTADRISGWRNDTRAVAPSQEITWARSAGTRSSASDPGSPYRRTFRSPVPSKTAISSAWRVRAGRALIRPAKTACRRFVSGSVSVDIRPAFCELSAMGSSSSASGLPCACDSSRYRARAVSAGYRLSSRGSDETCDSGRSSYTSMPARSKSPSSSVRMVARNPSRVPAVLRAINASTRPLARSSQGTSSTAIRIGVLLAARATSSRAAWDSVIQFDGAPSCSPRAQRSAVRCTSSSSSRSLPSSGNNSWCRPEKLTFASNWAPVARSTRSPAVTA